MSHNDDRGIKTYLDNVASQSTVEMYQYFQKSGLMVKEISENDQGVCLYFDSHDENYCIRAFSESDWYLTYLCISECYAGTTVLELQSVRHFLERLMPTFKCAIAEIPKYDAAF